MARLDDLRNGLHIAGVIPGERVTIIAAQPHGDGAVVLTYKKEDGSVDQRVLTPEQATKISIVDARTRPFNADAASFKLAAECQRIKLAGLFDPMLAVTTSDIEPLPHQLRAVYGELLPRSSPLRFLLADDPGAGKTIMAGLYIKELALREDVKRCLVVAPGGLVEQWQDELALKFGLMFDILTRQEVDAAMGASVFERHPLLIARMDQLARNDELLAALARSEWDLAIVDEAHRMGAHYFAGKLEKTKRFQLGELLGQVARHLLLMTATPHNGKEEDFQLFLTLLDRDRFEGRYRGATHSRDTSGLMRRMLKEDLVTFDGRALFPERVAETVPYRLTPLEQDLYDRVTEYVREGMNRADRLGGKRRNTVGFALTILQRRLASSPEAIYRSLERRVARLERRKQELLSGRTLDELKATEFVGDFEEFDEDELSAEELERAEEELVDAATAARTVEELDAELLELRDLLAKAARVRASGNDRKWIELRGILEGNTLDRAGADGKRRKLIIFTEHRDTLDYLVRRIRALLGRREAVVGIHGGVRRHQRREITEEFTRNPACQILVATDAAGEGLNLQAAHLMVNYDLPWNPNRIEQRFGRIHRIGQREVCRLWNLVAEGTREGDVFTRLLAKIDEQRAAYRGRVFDVLGAAFRETPLRKLLIEAIRYGELPETRARMERVISQSADEIRALLEQRALAAESLQQTQLASLRRQMDEARARRLQPHYIESAFRAAFTDLGGRIRRRERGRFEITHVPAELRTGAARPIASRYDRVTFDLEYVDVPDGPPAVLLAPGHPLHDAVIDATIARYGLELERGTMLVSPVVTSPRLLVGVVEEVVDATDTSIAKRFGYAFVDEHGDVEDAGSAPYLDCVAAPRTYSVSLARDLPWLADAEQKAVEWIVVNRLQHYLDEVRQRRVSELKRVREQVERRLSGERERLIAESLEASAKEARGEKPRESSSSLLYKAREINSRLTRRLELLDRQLEMHARPPHVVAAALVLPAVAVDQNGARPEKVPTYALDTREVERRGIERVLAAERALGREPVEQAFNNPGFDILSLRDGDDPIRIEVKARVSGAEEFFVTRNEVLTGLNSAPRYRLALVRVDPRGPEHDEVRYLADPFAGFDTGDFDATGHRGDWESTWARGQEPF